MDDVRNLRHMYGALSANNEASELFEALINEIERLQNRVAVLERVREWNEARRERRTGA